MAGFALRPSITVRFAVILSAVMALLLPAPGRCGACGTGKTDCSHCIAAKATAGASADRPCCQNHAATQHSNAVANTKCEQVRNVPCGCCVRPADRAWVPAERQVSAQDSLVALPIGQPLELDLNSDSVVAVAAIAN